MSGGDVESTHSRDERLDEVVAEFVRAVEAGSLRIGNRCLQGIRIWPTTCATSSRIATGWKSCSIRCGVRRRGFSMFAARIVIKQLNLSIILRSHR